MQYALANANEIKRFITFYDHWKVLAEANGKIKAKVKELGLDSKTDGRKIAKMRNQIIHEELDSYLKA